MRIIKFRAWDKEQKEFRYNAEQAYKGHWQMNNIMYFGQLLKSDKYDVMQYTGLKDLNDKEIYEGDILIGDAKIPCVVRWDNRDASFKAFDNSIIAMSGKYFNEREIIGNIYENPELVELSK